MATKRTSRYLRRDRGGPGFERAVSAKLVLVAEAEGAKPIGLRTDGGEYVTLLQYQDRPELRGDLAPLESLPYPKQAEFTIARLKFAQPDLRVRILGKGVFSRDAIIGEVEKGTPTGKHFVRVERIWVERLKAKFSKGEYKLRARTKAPEQAQAPATADA